MVPADVGRQALSVGSPAPETVCVGHRIGGEQPLCLEANRMNESLASLETIAEEECLDLLVRHQLGRIAVLAGEQPLIFPVNYAYGDRVIAFRTGAGTKLATAPNTRVAFEIDDYDPSTGVGWSVVVQGIAYEITHAIDRQSQLARRLSVQPLAPGERDRWIGIHPTDISGRRFRTMV